MTELISKKTRNEFREHLVGYWTLRTIENEFDNENIHCQTSYDPPVDGQRRTLVEQYYASLDFSKWSDILKLLRVYENILIKIGAGYPDEAQKLIKFLNRDGFTVENEKIISVSHGLPTLGHASDAATIFNAHYMTTQIKRINESIDSDPDLAIGSSKELLETCCKTILGDRAVEFDDNADLTKLVKITMQELKLLPDDVPDTAKGAEAIKRLLSNLAGVARGLTEVRNLYGSGHGKHGRVTTVKPRHAKLAVGAATTLVVFLFETHQETFAP